MPPKKKAEAADGDTSVAEGAEPDISYSGKQAGESETLGLDNYELPKSQVVKLAKSVVSDNAAGSLRLKLISNFPNLFPMTSRCQAMFKSEKTSTQR